MSFFIVFCSYDVSDLIANIHFYLISLSFPLTLLSLLLSLSVCLSLQDDMLLEDSKTLGDCGFTNQTARPQAPATVGLAFRISGQFTSLTSPTASHENSGHAPLSSALIFIISVH